MGRCVSRVQRVRTLQSPAALPVPTEEGWLPLLGAPHPSRRPPLLRSYGLDLFLLSIDEGISGYRDDSLETVKRNEETYQVGSQPSPHDHRTTGRQAPCPWLGALFLFVFRPCQSPLGAAVQGQPHVCRPVSVPLRFAMSVQPLRAPWPFYAGPPPEPAWCTCPLSHCS